eukprot:TRINITY_DN5019_c0_g1_i1.p1 TRINITY_DN5019_c0_g1~~TRINITY_DN5019_c0_g1_i1.p1  ORF type:complete len:348 (-),score=75.47 TRINITY_DN5019_c0_g1_i1:93-1136(-)
MEPADRAKAIVEFVSKWEWLVELSAVNFVTQQYWDRLPEDWREPLCALSIDELLQLPTSLPIQAAWPASLQDFLKGARELPLCAAQVSVPTSEDTWSEDTPEPLKKALKRGMCDKKVHEVEALAALIASTAKKCGVKHVLDFGAGQGYLSQVLHYRFGLEVTAVDNQPVQTSGCSKRNAQIEKVANKCNATMPASQMRVVQSHIQADLSEDQVCSMLSGRKRPREDEGAAGETTLERMPKAVLVGLHTCGDLGPTVIKAFLRCERAAAILNVGCCYNFLSVGSCDGACEGAPDGCGYPLSEHLRALPYRPTRTGSLMLAGQAVHRWPTNPKSAGMFKAHYYLSLIHI